MRLDKYIANNTGLSRKESRINIRIKKVYVNNAIEQNISYQIKAADKIELRHVEVKDMGNVYYVLDKPKGYISATKDKNHKTVSDLIPAEYSHLDLKPVGRLDIDTTGLLIMTNDDDFIHKMTSPKNKIEKTYQVTLADKFNIEYINNIQDGITLKDGTTTLPGKVKLVDDYNLELTIIEGKYHQVKRMFGALGNKVTELRRTKFGDYNI